MPSRWKMITKRMATLQTFFLTPRLKSRPFLFSISLSWEEIAAAPPPQLQWKDAQRMTSGHTPSLFRPAPETATSFRGRGRRRGTPKWGRGRIRGGSSRKTLPEIVIDIRIKSTIVLLFTFDSFLFCFPPPLPEHVLEPSSARTHEECDNYLQALPIVNTEAS